MKNAWLGTAIFGVLFAALGCHASSQDWNGTWQLSRAKSHYEGPTFTISVSTDGEYRFGQQPIRCDGKEEPLASNRTRVCVKNGAKVLDIVVKENGVKATDTLNELSVDGNVCTVSVTKFLPSGTPIAFQVVYSRLSGSPNDFAGRWLEASWFVNHAEMTLRLDDQILRIAYPNGSEYTDAPLNGVDGVMHGPRVSNGTTLSIRPEGSRKFVYQSKRDGRIITQGFLELSWDGKTVTDTWSSPDHPTDPATLVYEKR